MKPRFQCAVCGQKFVYECLLNNHVRSKHSAEKPFKCPFCEYGATEKGALKTHIRFVTAANISASGVYLLVMLQVYPC